MYNSEQEAQAHVDQQIAEASEARAKAEDMMAEMEALRVQGRSSNGIAEVTLSRSGGLAGLTLSDQASEHSAHDLSALIMEANVNAQQKLTAQITEIVSARCRIVLPRETHAEARVLLARDCDAHVDDLETRLGVRGPARTDVYVYRSAEEKRRAMGAGHTDVAKPWRAEVHVVAAPNRTAKTAEYTSSQTSLRSLRSLRLEAPTNALGDRIASLFRPVSSDYAGFHLHHLDVPKPAALLTAPLLLRLARAVRPDVIVERYYNFAGGAMLAARRLGLPAILEVNALIVDPPEVFKRRLVPASEVVVDWLRGLPGPIAVTYEAGPTGFGLYRAITAAGIRCLVAAPSKLTRPAGHRAGDPGLPGRPPSPVRHRQPMGRPARRGPSGRPAARRAPPTGPLPVLVIDEVGYIPFEPDAVNLLFQLV